MSNPGNKGDGDDVPEIGVFVRFTADQMDRLQQLADGQEVTMERFIHDRVFPRSVDPIESLVEALARTFHGRGNFPKG
jgi:hypothetical protein